LLSGEEDRELLSEEWAELSDDAAELSEDAENEHPTVDATTATRRRASKVFMAP
jgi:hypothetical protein